LLHVAVRGRPANPEWHAGGYEAFKLLGQLTGVFLIFMLVQSMTHFREAEIAVSHEAGDVLQLDRALAVAPVAQGGAARARLRDYVRVVVEQEWPAMRHGVDSPATMAALGRLQEAVAACVAAAPDRCRREDVGTKLNDVEDDHSTREGAAQAGLPPVLWGVTGGLFCLLIASAATLRAWHSASATLGLYAAGLGLLAALLFITDGPYRGDFSVTPRPLTRALLAMGPPG
jgi:hypothetical protein